MGSNLNRSRTPSLAIYAKVLVASVALIGVGSLHNSALAQQQQVSLPKI